MKKVYLTIDDSPSADMPKLIQYLQEHQLPAVFFCIGKNLMRYPDVAIEAIQAGFILGNHSWSHPHFSKISLEEAFTEIKKTDSLIAELYSKAGVQQAAKWFRFPYGDKGDGRKGKIFETAKPKGILRGEILQTLLCGLGYSVPKIEGIQYRYYREELAGEADWHWTFDVMEWATNMRKSPLGVNNLEQVYARIDMKQPLDCRGDHGTSPIWLESTSDEIILLHDHAETAALIPSILGYLSKKSLKFMSFQSLALVASDKTI